MQKLEGEHFTYNAESWAELGTQDARCNQAPYFTSKELKPNGFPQIAAYVQAYNEQRILNKLQGR